MERRHFLKLTFGCVAGASALAATANAAPLAPHVLPAPGNSDVHPAVTSTDEVDRLKPEQVRWGHHWHRRHWGWRHRWHRRHWGWRRHHRWHRHRW